MLLSLRLAAAAALVVVVALGGAYLLETTSSQAARSPGPSPARVAVATAAPTATTRPTPSATATLGPSPTLIPGTSLLTAPPSKLSVGVTYSTALFDPAFSLKGQRNWWYLAGDPGTAWFVQGPNEPRGPDEYIAMIVTAAKVIPFNDSTGPAAVPSDLVAWLRGRPDLKLGAPRSVNVGGLHGTALVGTVNSGMTDNAVVSLLCGAETFPCATDKAGALGFLPGAAFEIVVIQVHGAFVVVGLQGPDASWATDATVLDPFLNGLSFPGLSN